jgi:hypothetical protein
MYLHAAMFLKSLTSLTTLNAFNLTRLSCSHKPFSSTIVLQAENKNFLQQRSKILNGMKFSIDANTENLLSMLAAFRFDHLHSLEHVCSAWGMGSIWGKSI